MKKKIDPLGRLGIPKYIREDMKLDENSEVFIDYHSEKKEIRITKAKNVCAVCGCDTDLFTIGTKAYLCKKCFERIKRSL